MSKVAGELEKIQDRKGQKDKRLKVSLDPFQRRMPLPLWQRIKRALSFDRVVLLIFLFIATLVLIFRMGMGGQKERQNILAEISKQKAGISAGEGENVLETAVGGPAIPPEVAGGIPPVIRPDQEEIISGATAGLPEKSSSGTKISQTPVPFANVPAQANYFTVQLVTYNQETRAQEEIAYLKQRGQDALMIKNGRMFQVCAGRFSEKQGAYKGLEVLRMGELGSRYRDAFVRRVEGGV